MGNTVDMIWWLCLHQLFCGTGTQLYLVKSFIYEPQSGVIGKRGECPLRPREHGARPNILKGAGKLVGNLGAGSSEMKRYPCYLISAHMK